MNKHMKLFAISLVFDEFWFTPVLSKIKSTSGRFMNFYLNTYDHVQMSVVFWKLKNMFFLVKCE